MVIFLNFAPIEFMGGAEKWMNDTAKKVGKHEETIIISVSPAIANIYGRLVLKRGYEKRAKPSELNKNIHLTLTSFLPFTSSFKKTKHYFEKSRLIYSRYELSEYLLIFYFSGIAGIKKSIAGVHTPLVYAHPDSFFEKLHNSLYKSKLSKSVLKKVLLVHIMNLRDKNFLEKIFNLKNVLLVPNSIFISSASNDVTDRSEKLRVLFVGELSKRKGVDVLIKLIEKFSNMMEFTIVGDGYMKQDIEKITNNNDSISYLGHVEMGKLESIYKKHDVLLLPSRAESMSIAVLESLSYGLYIVNSQETSFEMPNDIEYSSKTFSDYSTSLEKLARQKSENKLNRNKIKNYAKQHFSENVINPILFKQIFNLNV